MNLADWFRSGFAMPDSGGVAVGGPITAAAKIIKPKPRIAAVRSAPSREEFRAWRDDATTQFVFAALRAARDNQKTAWDELSWIGGEADEMALVEFRTRADAYAGLEEADYEAFCEWAGVDPQPEEARDAG